MRASLVVVGLLLAGMVSAADAPAENKSDANGNPLRKARLTGHVSNYDEAKVGNYALPDPLVLANGQPVRDAATWTQRRRPEILRLYENEIYGRVPKTAPKVAFEVVATDAQALDGAAVWKHVVVRFGEGADAVKVNVALFTPAKAKGPVPVLLNVSFFAHPSVSPPMEPGAVSRLVVRDDTPIPDFIARGYGYATFHYTEAQADSAATYNGGVMKLAFAAGQTKPAAGEWGTISAWAWTASRVLDYLGTDTSVDPQRVALIGHSRLGKTALWAGATDPRFAVVFASCSGEMGAALARRDYGETVDDVAGNFPWWLTSAFQKYPGKWYEMPVDAHLLIALSAPRPVFVTGGTGDQWADPKGEFLAEVAAGPVYRLLGKKDLGTAEFPDPDKPLIGGELGFHYHTGGHLVSASDWQAFLEFAGRTLRP